VEFAQVYADTADLQQVQGSTDLNDACLAAILEAVVGDRVLDAGCGRGFLAERRTGVASEVVGCERYRAGSDTPEAQGPSV
jgi:protein-L-isoaspartate O-methyltransferase